MASVASTTNRVGENARGDDLTTIHIPDRDRTVVILQRDVGHAVLVEIAGAGDMPVGARVGDHDALADLVAVHLPDGDAPIVILQHDVTLAVAIEIAGPLNVPVGAR